MEWVRNNCSARLQQNICRLDTVNMRGTDILLSAFRVKGFISPGRLFAAAELKTMLAHIVITYDVKLEESAVFPASWRLATLIGANSYAKVMFRNRVD